MLGPGPSQSRDERLPAENSPSEVLRRAWQSGRELDLDALLAEMTDVAPGELAAMIEVDLEARWSRSDRKSPEEYLQRFPAVAADAELAVDVVYAEYLAREQLGERPQLSEYQARFPAFAATLADQIRLHHAFDALEQEELPPATSDPPSLQPVTGLTTEDGYELLEQIGSGGMGVVYKARQAALNRFVAIKMVRAIDSSNREMLARFRSEAHVVATLHHPHIVQVYDYGQHEGLPYIAMELVEGGTLADRLQNAPWTPHAAASLMITLADAVSYAHQRRVIHRDLKPANVLIDANSSPFTVKITDFGLAKLLAEDTSQHTRSYAFLGTPSYMAPEQAHGRAREIGPAVDIYSLGAIFCELLTGRPPFRGETPVETLGMLLSTEPASVAHMYPLIPRDLATICDKCLERDPRRRYASAAELHDDLDRYLQGKPIHARPIGSLERGWRWCSRNPLLAVACGSVAMLLVGIAVVSTWYSARLSHELTKTRAANLAAEHRLWDSYLSEAAARNASPHVGQRFAALDSIDRATDLLSTMGRDAERELRLRNAVLSSVALSDLRTLRSFELPPTEVFACDMSLAADCCVVAPLDGAITGYRLSDGERLWSCGPVTKPTFPILSRDGQFLATLDDDGATVWRIDEGKPRLVWKAPGARFFAFSPDGEYAAYSNKDEMRLVDTHDGQPVRTIGSGAARSKFDFDAASGRIAVCADATVQIIAGDTGKIEATLPLGLLKEPFLAWRPGGEYLAVWSDPEGIAVWHVESGTKVFALLHQGMPAQLKFNADGSMLASQSLWTRRLLACDVGSGQRFLEVPEFASHACDVGTHGRIVFLTVQRDKIVFSELVAGACLPLTNAIDAPLSYWDHTSVSPDGRIIACASEHGFEMWDVKAARRLFSRKIGPCSVKFDSDGRLIVACRAELYRFPRSVMTSESVVTSKDVLRNVPSRSIVRYGVAERLAPSAAPMTLSANGAGQTLLFENTSNWSLLHVDKDLAKIDLKPQGDPRKSAVSGDGRYAAIAGWERGGAEVWDARSGAKLADLAVGRHGVLQFSPDAKFLAATPDGVTLWSTDEWKCIHHLNARGTTPTGLGIAFSPDSRVLAVGQVNGVLSLFDTWTGKEFARLSHRDQSVASSIAFSPDQQWLLTSSTEEHSTAQLWDLAALRRELESRGLAWPADILQSAPTKQMIEGQLEVQFDDVSIFD
jgi:eukaryotic-like serine/threonine-protein kinase